MMSRELNNKKKVGILALLYSLYFFLAPFEDVLNFGAGTVLKYIAFVLIIIIFLNLVKKSIKINIYTPEIVLPAILMIISWASVLWSPNQSVSFGRNITYTLLPTLFIISNVVKFEKKSIELIKRSAIFGGLGIFIYIVYNFEAFSNNPYGRFTLSENNDPNNLAALLLLPLFVMLEYTFYSKGWKKIFCFSIVGALLFSILITGSRGALISVIGGVLYILLYELKSKKIFKIIIGTFGIFLIFYLIGLVIPDTITSRVFNIESYLSDFEGSGNRSDIWKMAILYVIPDMSILGYGSGIPPYVMVNYFGRLTAIHNTYLNIIIEYGVLGFPVFIYFLYYIYKKIKNKNIYYTGMLLSMLIAIIFLDSYAKKYFWNLMIFLIIYYNSTKRVDVNK